VTARRVPRRNTVATAAGITLRPSADLEAALGYRFTDRRLLDLALVHRSVLNEMPEGTSDTADSNERLEFLGDSVIGFVVARELYRRFPQAQEGRLTELRAHLVRWETLGEAGAALDLGSYLRLSRGEERSGGRDRPLILARAYEAVAGAILEDGTLKAAERFVLRTLRTHLAALDAASDVSDVKSRLQSWAQGRFGLAPSYRTVGVSGPDHARTYAVEVVLEDRVLGSGTGPNKRSAERAAAAQALQRAADDSS
jgi:ribonuclease-3